MDFIERINVLAKRIPQIQSNLQTEEATKNALIMPFLDKVLGWDVYDPTEVIPEFTADTINKKGEKVDYALMKDGEVQILIECKKYGEKLTIKHASQLFRYFSVTNARLAILTNGSEYQIFTDSDAPNKMDEKPFLKFDLEDIDEHIIPEVRKLAKSVFNIDSIVSSAGELKYLSQIKKIVAEQLGVPEADIKNESSFVNDLGADSLDTVELVMALEDEFGIEIPDEEAEKITTVQLAIDFAKSKAQG